ncbi:MAG TPA: GAF domain-containing protein [Gemmatimonadales bacterium]|nr:GAF domain-containing protein [Gemmatimonadales bacterium]
MTAAGDAAKGALPLDLLAAIARATAGLVDPAELARVVKEQAERLVPLDAFYLALWDPSRQRFRFFAHGEDRGAVPPEERPLGRGPTSWVVRHRRPYVVNAPDDPVQTAGETFGTAHRSGSAVHVPMFFGERLVGVLSVQCRRPGAYDDDAVRLLEALGAHAAIALEAGRIAAGARQAEASARASLAASRILRELVHDLAGLESQEAAVERGLQAAMELTGADGAALAWRAEDRPGSLVVLGVTGHEARYRRVGETLDEASVEAAVVRTAVERVSDDLSAEPEVVAAGAARRAVRAGIVLPVMLGWNAVGALVVSAAEVAWRRPGESERLMLRAVGDQLAASLSALRVREQLERRLEQIDALGRVAHALTGVEDADRTMHSVATEGMRVFGAQRAAVYLMQRPGGRVECMVSIGLSREYVATLTAAFDRTRASAALRERRPFFEPDVAITAPPELREAIRAEGFASLAALPLIFADEVIGALAFYHDHRKVYTADERRLATAFADQAALAIGKSRLLDQVSRVKREWQSAFDAPGSGLAIVDPAGKILRANRAVAELAGVPVTALPGLELRSFLPGWPEGDQSPLARALAGGARVTTFLEAPDGRRLVVSAAPIPDAGLMVAIDDVTEIARLEERFFRVVQTAYDAIVIADADGRITFANPAAAELFARETSALVGRPMAELLPGGPPGTPTEPGRFEATIRRPDGGERLVAVSSAPLAAGEARPASVAVLRDVTQERASQEALRRSEARFRALFAAAPLSIFSVDRRGGFRSVNRATVRMAGLARREPNRRLQEFLLPEEVERIEAEIAASFRGETRDFMFYFRRADGAIRRAAAISVPVEEEAGEDAVLIIARDVTDELRLREQLGHSEKLAALGRLVSGVAHELNNPLAGIAALAQALILEREQDPGAEQVLETIRREATRAGRIVGDLLTFARQRPIERRVVDLNQVVRDTLDLHARTAASGARWELALADDLPGVSADPDQLRQVLLNLLTNADHAMRGVASRVGRIRTYATPERVGCEVADSGPGIPPEAMPRIFEPFFTTKGVGEGTGLGLSISHGIVRAHGGEIRVENRPGGGAAFTVELPRG